MFETQVLHLMLRQTNKFNSTKQIFFFGWVGHVTIYKFIVKSCFCVIIDLNSI